MKLVIALLVTCCLATSQAKAVVPNHQNTDTDREITVPESIVSSLNTAIKNVSKIIPHSVMPILPDIAAIVAHVVTSNLPNSRNKKTDKLLRSSDEAAQLGLPEVLEQLNIPIPASVEATLQATFGKLFQTPKRPANSSTQDELPAALREIEVILPNGAENYVNMAILSLYEAIPQSLLPVVPNIVAIAMHLGNPNSNMRSDSSPDGSDKMSQLRLPAASREWKFTLPNSTEAAIASLHPNIAESVMILQPAAEAAVTAIMQLLAGNASPLDN